MNEQTLDVDPDSSTPDPGTGARPLPPPIGEPARQTRWFRVPVARDKEHGKVGGVVAGVSRAFGFDLRTTRIAVAIASLVVPPIVALYLVAWVLLPRTQAEAVGLEALARDRKRLPLYIAIALVIVLGGLGSLGSWQLFGGIPWGLALVAVGVLLWVAGGPVRATDPAPGTPSTAVPPPPPTTRAAATTVADTTGPAKRKRYPVGRIAMVAVVAFLVLAQLGDAANLWTVPVLATIVTSLSILAAGAVVGIIVNRSWLPVPTLLVTSTVATFLLIVNPPFDGGVGERTERPMTVEQAQVTHRLSVGQLTVDLTAVPFAPVVEGAAPVAVTVETTLGIGQLRIVVPADLTLQVDLEVGAGHAVLDGQDVADGMRQHVVRTLEPVGASRGTLVLHAEVGLGELTVERRPAG